ncbi:hypothetical protein Tco_0532349 [Tanacetum coccineum]
MYSNFNNENEPWEFSLDIDDSDLHLTPVIRSSSSTQVEPSPYTPNPKVVEDVDEDDDFNSGAWVSATNYVNAFGGTVTGCLGDIDNFLKKEKLEQVVAIVKYNTWNNTLQISDNEDEVESPIVVEKKTVVPTIPKVNVVRPKQQEKPVRKTVRYAEMYRSKGPRGNQRNWNNLKSQQLGSDFVMNNKACFVCGSFDHLKKDCGKRITKPVWKNTRRVNDYYSTRMTYSNPRRNMIPQAVLMRSGIKAVNTAKPKDAHNAVKRKRFNAVKASACWVWMPKNRVVDHVSKNISASVTLK